MKAVASRVLALLTAISLMISVSACFRETERINGTNWKFESLESNGTKLTAADFSEDQMPVFICDGSLNVFFYYNGVIRHGRVLGNVNYSYFLEFVDSKQNYDAYTSGDKLTLYFEGNGESKMIFRATKEQVYIPVAGETKGTYLIDAYFVDKGVVEFVNRDDETWCFGEYYKLEVMKGSTWFYVPYLDPYGVHDLGHELAPGQKTTLTYDLKYFGRLTPGAYRLAVGDVGDGSNIYYAYFMVEADGTYTFPQ